MNTKESIEEISQEISDRLFKAVEIIDIVKERYSEILQKDDFYDKLKCLSFDLFEISQYYDDMWDEYDDV